MGKTLQDTGIGMDFSLEVSEATGNNSKNCKMRLHQIKRLLHSKGTQDQSEDPAYRMGKDELSSRRLAVVMESLEQQNTDQDKNSQGNSFHCKLC